MLRNNKQKSWNIVSEWGILSSRPNSRTGQDIEVRLTKTSWFGKMPQWDLRNWEPNFAGQGVVIGSNDDLHKLRDMLISVCEQIDENPEY